MSIGLQLICSFSHVSFPGITELSSSDEPTKPKIFNYLVLFTHVRKVCQPLSYTRTCQVPSSSLSFLRCLSVFHYPRLRPPQTKLEKLVPLLLDILSSHADKNPLTYKNLSTKLSPATLVTYAWLVVEKDKFLEFFYKSSLVLLFYSALK